MKKVMINYTVLAIIAGAGASVLFLIATLTENMFLAFVTSYMLISLLFVSFCFYVIGYGIVFLSRKLFRKIDDWYSNNYVIVRKPIVIKSRKNAQLS